MLKNIYLFKSVLRIVIIGLSMVRIGEKHAEKKNTIINTFKCIDAHTRRAKIFLDSVWLLNFIPLSPEEVKASSRLECVPALSIGKRSLEGGNWFTFGKE